MPWQERSVMEERLCFVARLLEGETMSEMCREFGISRKTGFTSNTLKRGTHRADGAFRIDSKVTPSALWTGTERFLHSEQPVVLRYLAPDPGFAQSVHQQICSNGSPKRQDASRARGDVFHGKA